MPDALDHTVGAPVPGVSVRVVDNREIELPVGHEGELRLKGPQCFLGYADAALDADAFDNDGWLRTAISGCSMRMAMSMSRVESKMRSSATRRMFRRLRSRMCSSPIPRWPMLQSSACPTLTPASAYAPWWYLRSVDSVSLESLVQHCRSRGLSRDKLPERLVIVDALPRNQARKSNQESAPRRVRLK